MSHKKVWSNVDKIIDRDNARNYLLRRFEQLDNTPVYVLTRSVAKSGMSRKLSLFIVTESGIQDITNSVCMALEVKPDKKGYYPSRGCGMNMHFAVVYDLSSVLYPDGFAVDGIGRNGDTSGWDKNGGYKLKHRSL